MCAPPLKHISIWLESLCHGAHYSRDNAAKEAFLRHAPTLESLQTHRCDFPKEIILAIRCSCPALHSLKTIDVEATVPDNEVELDALRVADSPWKCNLLEQFDCRILDVPRPDIVITPLENVLPNPPIPPLGPLPSPAPAQDQTLLTDAMLVAQQESHAIQRGVLKQLGQLAHLWILRLGRYGREPYRPQYSRLEIRGICTMAIDAYFDRDCLELTLERGLDELRRLQELQELQQLMVYQMAHWIGLKEVKWIVENWPKLRSIGGLWYKDDCNWEVYGAQVGFEEGEPEHVRWIRENRPDIQFV